MKTQNFVFGLAVGVWLVVLAGCASDQKKAEELVIPLTKLAGSVQGTVSFGDKNALASEQSLLSEAMKDKPELQQSFKDVKVKLRYDTSNAIVLVCSPDGKFAWLETAGWKPFEVKKHFLSTPPPPAEFTISLPVLEPVK